MKMFKLCASERTREVEKFDILDKRVLRRSKCYKNCHKFPTLVTSVNTKEECFLLPKKIFRVINTFQFSKRKCRTIVCAFVQ